MPTIGLQSLVNYGSVSMIRELKARGVIPDFSPADWLQAAVTANNDSLVRYLCEGLTSFPSVITGNCDMITALFESGYPSDQLLMAALASSRSNCITATLSMIHDLVNSDLVYDIIESAGKINIGALLLSVCNSHPEKIEGIVDALVKQGNAASLAAIAANETAAACIRNTSNDCLRRLVMIGACATVEVILTT